MHKRDLADDIRAYWDVASTYFENFGNQKIELPEIVIEKEQEGSDLLALAVPREILDETALFSHAKIMQYNFEHLFDLGFTNQAMIEYVKKTAPNIESNQNLLTTNDLGTLTVYPLFWKTFSAVSSKKKFSQIVHELYHAHTSKEEQFVVSSLLEEPCARIAELIFAEQKPKRYSLAEITSDDTFFYQYLPGEIFFRYLQKSNEKEIFDLLLNYQWRKEIQEELQPQIDAGYKKLLIKEFQKEQAQEDVIHFFTEQYKQLPKKMFPETQSDVESIYNFLRFNEFEVEMRGQDAKKYVNFLLHHKKIIEHQAFSNNQLQ